MKKLIIGFVILTTAIVWSVNLENRGRRKIGKVAKNHVWDYMEITDINGVKFHTFGHYGLKQSQAKLTEWQTEYQFYDMNAVEAITYVAKKKTIAAKKVVLWQAIVNKFDGAIDGN